MFDSELILSRNLTNPFESSTNILRKVETFLNSEKEVYVIRWTNEWTNDRTNKIFEGFLKHCL